MKTAMTGTTGMSGETFTHEGVMRVIAAIDAENARQERVLQELFAKNGFDITAGDVMFVPKGSNLHIPPKYQNQVREHSLVNGPLFMKNAGGILY